MNHSNRSLSASIPSHLPQNSEAVFKTIFEQSPQATVLVRLADDVLVEVNEEWLRLTGFERQEVLGRTAVQIGQWLDPADRERALAPLRAGGRVVDADVTMVMKDGKPRAVRMNAAVVQTQGDAYILFYLRDISTEKNALKAMREQLAFIQKITSRAPGMVYEFQMWPDGRISFPFVSAGVQSLFGVSEHELYADPKQLFRQVDEQDLQHLREVFEAASKSHESWQCEVRARSQDGVLKWLLASAVPEPQGDGSVLWCGSITDISVQKEALARAQESEARFRSLTDLSSDWYWEQDEHFRFVRLDRNALAAQTLPASRYIGKARWETGAQGVSEEAWAKHRATLEAHETFLDFEMQRVRDDGTLMWVTISGAPIFDSNGVFKGYRGTGRDISARKHAEAEIERLAFYDALTGLPNRRMLLDRLSSAIAASTRLGKYGALLFIDLDNFKVLNDTMGHQMGDELLKKVAQRLSHCVRAIDTVARLGGDEFVVMLEDLDESVDEAAKQTEVVGRKILATLNQHFDIGGQEYHSSPSIGATLFLRNTHSVDELLKRADLAMYQSKAAGRNTLRFFDPAMQAAASERATLESDMRLALLRHEFVLHYQPVVNAYGAVTGVEALIRWLHPLRGLVSPAKFIPVAEQSGLILSLGQWVLERACAQLVAWAEQADTAMLTLAVNVSARQFRHPDFSTQLLALIATTGANPHRLKLELTESLLLSDIEDAIAKMSELRAEGVGFALDDFGTGYSSLSYLKRLPLDQLKIDQSFVRDVLLDPNDAAIARTILNLAESLELGVVAEGVETQGQRDFLLDMGCKAFQGYFFGKPVPVDQLRLTPCA